MDRVLKAMFEAGTGVNAAEFTGGRATQLENTRCRRPKRRKRQKSVLADHARKRKEARQQAGE